MPIHRRCGSEMSLTSLMNNFKAEEELLTSTRTTTNEKPICITIPSFSTLETVTSFESLDLEKNVLPKSILKVSGDMPNVKSEDESLQAWINQPIPDCQEASTITPSRRHRRRRSTDSTPNKYDQVKTRFPGKELGRKERTSRRTRKQHPEKTVEEQWVKTCRFLW